MSAILPLAQWNRCEDSSFPITDYEEDTRENKKSTGGSEDPLFSNG